MPASPVQRPLERPMFLVDGSGRLRFHPVVITVLAEDGTFAEITSVPTGNLARLPSEIPDEIAGHAHVEEELPRPAALVQREGLSRPREIKRRRARGGRGAGGASPGSAGRDSANRFRFRWC